MPDIIETPEVGEALLANHIASTFSFKIELIVADFTPTNATVESDLTLPTDPSYAAAEYAPGDATGDATGSIDFPQHTFVFSSAATAYGYALFADPAGGTAYTLLSVIRWSGVYSWPDGGGLQLDAQYNIR